MNNWRLSLFLGRRLSFSKSESNSFSGPVVRLVTMAVAVCCVVMLIAIVTGTGLQQEIKNKIYSFRGHIQVKKYIDESDLRESESIKLTDEMLLAISSHEAVKYIQSSAYRTAVVKSSEFFDGVVLKGIDRDFNSENLGFYLQEGRIFSMTEKDISDSLVISSHLARVLAVSLGDRVAVYFIRESPKPPLLRYLYISGIYETGVEDVDKQFAYADMRLIREVNRWNENEVGSLEIFLKKGYDPQMVAFELEGLLPYDLQAQPAEDAFRQLFQWMSLFDINILIIIIVMVVISAINLSSALMILIVERTRMIGMLKALGAENGLIFKIFLFKAFVILSRGLLMGNLVALGYALIQKKFKLIKLDQTAYFVDSVPVYFQWNWILYVNAGTLLICLLMMLLPVRYISHIPATKVLKFE